MASVCGSTLSLMDAGVPIKKPVAGIAMGLMVKDPDKGIEKDGYLILTDIQGMEDNIGDMDFKVAGTKDGITALQMDIKVSGVSADILGEALEKAKMARTQILETMAAALATHRPQVSPYAPKVKVVRIAKEQIGEIIGPGGRVIRQIIAVTGAQVDVDDEGKVTVSAQDQEAVNKAAAWIEGMTREVEVGEVFEQGEVKRTLPFGAFVEILPGREGMVHVSKMATTYVKKPEDVVSIGDKVKVRVEEIDDMGRINLSMLFGEAAQHRPAPGGEMPRRPEQRPYDRGNRFEHRPHRRFPQRDHHRSGPGRDQGSRPQESAPRRPKPTAARPHTLADWHED
jgi:polyribonucleotide nucleotidyltransferase